MNYGADGKPIENDGASIFGRFMELLRNGFSFTRQKFSQIGNIDIKAPKFPKRKKAEPSETKKVKAEDSAKSYNTQIPRQINLEDFKKLVIQYDEQRPMMTKRPRGLTLLNKIRKALGKEYDTERRNMSLGARISKRLGIGMFYRDGENDMAPRLVGDVLPDMKDGTKMDPDVKYAAYLVASGQQKSLEGALSSLKNVEIKDTAVASDSPSERNEASNAEMPQAADLSKKTADISSGINAPAKPETMSQIDTADNIHAPAPEPEILDAIPTENPVNSQRIAAPDDVEDAVIILDEMPKPELLDNSILEANQAGDVAALFTDKEMDKRQGLIQNAISASEVSQAERDAGVQFKTTRKKPVEADLGEIYETKAGSEQAVLEQAWVDKVSTPDTQDKVDFRREEKQKVGPVLFNSAKAEEEKAHNVAIRKKGPRIPDGRDRYNKGMQP